MKKTREKFWSGNRFLNWKILNFIILNLIFIKSKICISQLIAKQPSLNQIRHCLKEHNQIWHHFFRKSHWTILINLKFLSFMTKVNPNNESETTLDIFPWDIFKICHHISFYQKNWRISMTLNSKQLLKTNVTFVNQTKLYRNLTQFAF